MLGQVHNLLGRAATFNRCARVREDRRAAGEGADELPGLVDDIIGIIAAHALASETLFEADDFVAV